MSTGCEFYGDALVDLEAGRLDAERTRRVEDHLDACSDCRAALEVIRAVRSAPAPVPDGLEARIRASLSGGTPAPRPVHPVRPADGMRWRPWALPVAVAAALALWIGGSQLLSPDATLPGAAGAGEVETEYPYGAWPGSNGVVAGEVVLSELSVEELEALLEELDS